MLMLLTSVRHAVRLAPFLALPLFGTFAAGCGGGSEVDPNIKVDQSKSIDESTVRKGAPRGAKTQDAAPKQRLGGGPG